MRPVRLRRTIARGIVTSVLGLAGCGRWQGQSPAPVTLHFWAFGREGEVVQSLMPAFEHSHPGVHVRVEQIPFTAAHEKLLTAVVGRATPDLAQLGNTWLAELVTLHAVAPLDSLIDRSTTVVRSDYFPGIWDTNVLDDTTYGIPWYVDTRVLFYRSDLLADAGYPTAPRTWRQWRDAMRRVRARSGGRHYGILLPVNEWAQPVILGMSAGAPLLRDDDQYGDFEEPRFAAAFDFYIGLYRDSLAQPVSNVQIGNLYQSFARGDIAMFISGPWDVGECMRRLPDTMRGRWMTAPMPASDDLPPAAATGQTQLDTTAPGISLAGGSSLVIFRASPHARAAWQLVEYLSAPAQQAAFYRLAEDLPPRRSVWQDSAIASNPYVRAFARQLTRVRPTPRVPEWEQITHLISDHGEGAARSVVQPMAALHALDADVNRLLEKRRWVIAQRMPARAPGP